MFYQGFHTLKLTSIFICYRKDEGNSSAMFVDVPVSSLNVQLQGQSGSLRRKRATDLSWPLTGLEEYMTYVIQVLFYTVGNSPYSLPLEIQTSEDGRSGVVSGTLVGGGGVGRGLRSMKPFGSRGSWRIRG